MKRRFGSLIMVFLLMIGLGFTLAACGDGTDLYEQGITKDSIIIGNTAAVTGDFAGVGVPFNLAMEVVFDEYNAAREEGERKIVFKHYNDEFDGNKGLSYTKTLVEEDKVFALVGHFGTNTIESTMDYLLESGVPMVYGVTGVNSLYFEEDLGNNILSVQPIYRTEGQIMVARALHESLFGPEKNAKLSEDAKIAVLYSNEDAGNSIRLGVEEEIIAQEATTKAIYFPFTVNTAAATVNNVLAIQPDVILLAANQQPATAAATQLRLNNSNIPVITSYVNGATAFTPAQAIVTEIIDGKEVQVPQPLPFEIYANAWVDITDPTAPAPTVEQVGGDGTLAGFDYGLEWLPGFTAEYWEFVKLLNDSDRKSGTTAAKDLWANPYAIAGFVAAKTFVALLDKVEDFDTITWESFIELAEAEPIKLPMAGTIDWTEGKRHGLSELALTRFEYLPNVTFNKVRAVESKEVINKK